MLDSPLLRRLFTLTLGRIEHVGLRDLLLFGLIFGLLPSCLLRPWIGLLVYSCLSYLNPHRLTWGLAYDFPFAQLVALVTIAGVGLHIIRQDTPKFPLKFETFAILLLWALFFATTWTALLPDLAWPRFSDISKIFGMTLLTIWLIDDARKLRWLILVIAVSLGFYGVKGGLFAVASGGQFMVFGPDRSFIADNTALGIALNMVLPILYFLARAEKNVWYRRAIYACFGLTFLATIFTYSRGAFLGLVVVAGMLFLHLSALKKAVLIGIGIIALPAIIGLVPQQYLERVETIQTYEQDGSANARLTAWAAAWEVAKARPLTGGGFQIIDDVLAVQEFYPEFNRTAVGVHSIYFEVLAENGFISFFVFVALLISAILGANSMRRRFKHTDPKHPFYDYGSMITIGLLSYAVTGVFLEFASFDLFYHFVAIVVIMKRLAPAELAAVSKPAAVDASNRATAADAATVTAYLTRPTRPSPYVDR